jgi:hypothetical protein
MQCYSKRLVAFIDVLGFGDLVMESKNEDKKFHLILEVLEKIQSVDDIYGSPNSFFAHSNYSQLTDKGKKKLQSIYEIMKKVAEPNRIEVTTFSDSIVFSAPANEDGLSNFRYFLINLNSSFNQS